MAQGGPRKAGGPSKKGTKSKVTLLTARDSADIPPMPDPEVYIPFPGGDPAVQGGMDSNFDESFTGDLTPQWNSAVERWWNAIWTSPMSSEFIESDIHGLYLACVYMHEGLNPFNKPGDRLSFMKAYEAAVKNFGLTPSARESLKWQVAQGTAAQNRTDLLRSQAAEKRHKSAGSVTDLYKRHSAG